MGGNNEFGDVHVLPNINIGSLIVPKGRVLCDTDALQLIGQSVLTTASDRSAEHNGMPCRAQP
jgi:hypothetical protein